MLHYPEAVNLPFNGEVLRENFRPVFPGQEPIGGDSFWVILQRGALVVCCREAGVELYYGAEPEWLPDGVKSLVIGRWQGKDLRLARLPGDAVLPDGFSCEPFNAAKDILDDKLLTLGGFGLQIAEWDRHSCLCSRCGGRTSWIDGTWGKRCMACRYEHFPHIHPCAIILVKRGDEFLLARKPAWAPGRYGLVAGFLDIGESLEECARREVEEETGIIVKNVRYVGSQCWPFPSQLMAGFVADYAGGNIRVDRTELDDAAWFSPENLPDSLPPRRSIARWIIDRYALPEGQPDIAPLIPEKQI